jgi:Fe-S-cluster-containing hydrogenase component 2
MKERKMPVVVEPRCPKNHKCPAVRICPVGALKQERYDAPTIEDNSVKCGKCAMVCPRGAIIAM